MAKISKGWVFDKNINLSNLLTALVIAVSVIWWAAQIEKRIAVLEIELKAFYEAQIQIKAMQLHRDKKQDDEVQRLDTVMQASLNRLESKVDKLLTSKL
ncbi:MAG TPA: hypothetical protein VFP93_00025 [Gammaproteobacteria bacterium]|nr:hypothetical protein [Gammaproteobacteria bacterium]